MATLLLPQTDRNKGGARFNPKAVADAVDFLDVDLPVQIKWSAGINRLGAHRLRNNTHVITISTYLTADQASTTLWHELAHAAQTEQLGPMEFRAAYVQESRYNSYRRNRFEVEAREVAEVYGAEAQLTY